MGKKIQIMVWCLAIVAMLSGCDFFNSKELKNAEPAHAEVLKVKGEVRKISSLGGRVSKLLPGNALFVDDSVQTGANSAVTIVFADDSRILVAENSHVSMVRLLKSRNTSEVDTLIEITAGSVESRVTTKESFGARYEVRTPSMHMAVRGTQFSVRVDSETGQSCSSVLEGKVVATAAGKQVELPAGYGTFARKGQEPAEPMQLLAAPVLAEFPEVSTRIPLQFSWQPAEEATQYRLQVLSGTTADLLIHDEIYSSNMVDLADLPNAKYLLRVCAINNDGLEGLNVEQLFSVAAHPIPPVASWPINTTSPSSEKVKFRWANTEKVRSYLFQVSEQEDFSTIVSEVKELPGRMKGISVLLAPGHYFWRVASTTKQDGQGPFSDHYTFSVVESAK